MRNIILSILGVLFIIATVFISKLLIDNKNKPKPIAAKVIKTVFTDTVNNTTIPIVIPANGNLTAKQRVELYSEVQGIFRNKKLLPNVLRNASWDLMGYIDKPALREELALKRAKEAIQNYVGDINAFFEGDWREFRARVKNSGVDFFSAQGNE